VRGRWPSSFADGPLNPRNAELKGGGNIFVDVDPEDKIADCHPGNNLGAGALGICPG